ncbi:hypothetical protein [Alloscardovia criceti]|uniref:hypothetical protein n=1 Tax=Alloscardovia criceti TaxID=356828 RepID=UPI00036EB3A3|nr:hypothetical protein [Alloscardovia criceti]
MNDNVEQTAQIDPIDAPIDSSPEADKRGQDESSKNEPSWNRPKVMRLICGPLFAVLAIVALVLAILNLTIFKPAKIVTAQTSTDSTYVVTNAGVADLISNEVSVTATIKETAAERDAAVAGDENAEKRTVCVAVGSTTDVDAWMTAQAVAYTTIDGLSSWSELSTSSVAQSGTAAQDSVAMADSDLWQQSNCAERTVTLRLTSVQGNQKVIMYSPSGISSVRMNWTRSTLPNTALPWFILAAVAAVLSALSFTWLAGADPFGVQRRKAKREAERAALIEAHGEEALIPGIDTPYVPYQKKSTSGITHRTRKNGIFSRLFSVPATQEQDKAEEDTEKKNTPIVVDPSSVNMVASTGAGASDHAWSPSVINHTGPAQESVDGDVSNTGSGLSGEDYLEYFARLAIEDRKNADNSDDTTGAEEEHSSDESASNADKDNATGSASEEE